MNFVNFRLPSRVSLFGDSQCTSSSVECELRTLEVWLGNQFTEIRDHMNSWQNLGIVVDALHHWPGDLNNADLPTRGKVTYNDINPDSGWQL